MSYQVYFMFSEGLNKAIMVPKGTIDRMQKHIEDVESTLNIKREKYKDNPERWAHTNYSDISDKVLCETAESHNARVRWFYELLEKSSNEAAKEPEELTNDVFQQLLPGLSMIRVKPERWTGDYYTERMQALYEVMRGRDCEGISFDAKKLTEKQAAAVVTLFSEFLDHDDRRLDVPKGHDYLASSYNGGYEWCEKCGAITYEDSLQCRRSTCPLLAEYERDQME